MSDIETLIEGKYNYYQGDHIYSEESFRLNHEDRSNGNYFFDVSTNTRVKTGEFLRVKIKYILNNEFEPTMVSITRMLGPKKSIELFNIDQKTSTVTYEFDDGNSTQYFEKIVSGRFHFATPSFSLSMLMTHMRKIDPVHRTPYTIITSKNIWEYSAPFQEEEIYVELQSLDLATINIGGNDLKASHCKLLQVDENGTIATEGYDIYLSKYYSIPYVGYFADNIKIEIDKLKNFDRPTI